MKLNIILFGPAVIVGCLLLSCKGDESGMTKSGLKITDLVVGDGAEAATGMTVEVDYTGWLWENEAKGKQFDSSVGRKPYKFKIGAGSVIKGWDEGIVGMKVGGKRELIIPPELAYGDRGFPGAIPPNATLVFDVELVGIAEQ
jgi:peptidylprolyl isomerase